MWNKDGIHWFVYLASAVFGLTAGMFLSYKAALLAVGCVAFCALPAFFFECRRKRKLRALALDMDRLLHGDYRVRFKNYEEGETEVVANELAKITDTLQTQAEKLRNEKKYLADSIADISHQIRTLLTALNLTLETMGGREAADPLGGEAGFGEEYALRLKQAKQLTHRIEWLIEALLKLSKLDAGTVEFVRETVTVEKLIRDAAKPFGILMDLRGQTLDTKKVMRDAAFTGDLAWSTEAVGNILKNCIEHTAEGGLISVAACENAIYTEIVVEDNGEGFDPQDLSHLFERFYKGRNSSGNSVGIGLALTRAILLAQNGTICAENRREGGARFLIRIYKGIV